MNSSCIQPIKPSVGSENWGKTLQTSPSPLHAKPGRALNATECSFAQADTIPSANFSASLFGYAKWKVKTTVLHLLSQLFLSIFMLHHNKLTVKHKSCLQQVCPPQTYKRGMDTK
jgi:hypothetical protein